MDESFDFIRGIIPATETIFVVPASAPVSFTGPGDVVASAVSFWGLRAYSSASIGANAVRLRETGGNTEQDFATIAGGGLDLAAISAFKGANNLFVVKLYDQVSTNHFTQTTAGNQPQFILNAIGSLPAIQFIAASSTFFDTGAVITQAQPFTYSIVFNNNNDTGAQVSILGGGNSATEFGAHRASANDIFIFSGGSVPTATANASAWHAGQIIFNNASSDMYVDGTTNPSNLGTSTGIANGIVMGQIGGAQFYGGFVGEVGLWGSAFSGTNESNMNANQHAYWGF